MDFAIFKKAAKLLPDDISIIMRGRHGIGKTEVVRQLAEEFNLPIIERRLSQLTEGDLIGLPFNYQDRITKYLPPEWFAEAMDSPHLLFLDEFDRSINEVQQAAMELILDRSIQGQKIHPQCRIYAAINGGKYGSLYKINNMDPALYDRFWIVDCDPSIEEWLKWATCNDVIQDIVNFISTNKEELEKNIQQDVYKITPSRRSWTRLSNVLRLNPFIINDVRNSKGNSLFIAICSGFVGIESTGLFLNFITNPENHIFAEDILDRFDQNIERFKSFKIEHLNFAIDKVSYHTKDKSKKAWSKDQVKNVAKFFELLSPELRIVMWDKLTSPNSKIENMQLLSRLVSDLIINLT